MAPFQGGTQRLLARWRGTVVGACEQLQPVLQRRQQPLHAERGHACRGQFDGQGQPIERAAELYHRRRVGVGQCEVPIGGLGALGKQGDGAEVQRLRRRQRARRHGQRIEPEHTFDGQLQRRLAGDEQAQARCVFEQGQGDTRHGRQQELGVVQRHQHAQRRDGRAQARQRLARAQAHAQGRGDGFRQGQGVAERGQLDPADPMRPDPALREQEGLRQPRLADAAGAHERDEPVRWNQRAQGGEVVVTAEQAGRPLGQVGARRGVAGRRVGRGDRRQGRRRGGSRREGRRVKR